LAALGDRDLCGSSTAYFWDASSDRAWRYAWRGFGTMLVGTTLFYRKQLWRERAFPDVQIGEDNRFIDGRPRPVDMNDPEITVATVHAANTSRKILGGSWWRPAPSGIVHALAGERLGFEPEDERPPPPLVSCIMPTFDRRRFVTIAVDCFLAQDWPRKELIVVDDGTDPVGDLCRHRDIRYIRLPHRTSIGNKRNLACQEARGDVIMQWDDDDWYGPDRLRRQALPILDGSADLTGIDNRYVLQLPSGDFWTVEEELHRRMFVGDVHGGTIAFRRALMLDGVRYPDSSLGEDAVLIKRACAKNQRVVKVPNDGAFVYTRHGRSTWRFETGRFMDPSGWRRTEAPPNFPSEILEAYRAAAR